MLKIRLARGGAKKRPYYQIVVADSHSPRDGRFIERVGSYNPLLPKDAQRVTLKVERIQGVPVLCIYGEEETDSLCPMLDARHATLVKLKGGHHFDGDYSALAGAILQAAFAATVLSGS